MSQDPHAPPPPTPPSSDLATSPKATPAGPKDYQTQQWSSGTRGGGKVPADFGWRTNPKQWQEELGAAVPKSRQVDPDKKP